MDYQSAKKRLEAAAAIFQSHELSKSTFDNLQALLKGIHPRIDTLLVAASKAVKPIDLLEKGDVIQLTVEAIPEVTEKDKRRKKAILFFLNSWNDLKSEVARVEKEFDAGKSGSQNQMGTLGKIFSATKGPLAIVTIAAVAIVGLKMTEVTIRVRNSGCQTMTPVTSVAVNIPGVKLPSEAIPDGGEAIAKLPPVSVNVDAVSPGMVRLTMYGIKYDFSLESPGIRLNFDGKSLNGERTTINLGSQKQHLLTISCK